MYLILTLVAVTSVFLITNKRYRWIYIFIKTFKRDFRGVIGFLKFKIVLWWWDRQNYTVIQHFAGLVKAHPNKIALYFEDTSWTYEQVNEYSNQIANYFKKEGFVQGDCIALLLENRPEYPCIWLGLSKIGVVAALINTNLYNDPLKHSFQVAKSRAVVYGSNHAEVVENMVNKLNLKCYQFNVDDSKNLPGCIDLRKKLSKVCTKEPEGQPICNRNPLFYIFTSGTTGLPKAAVISHTRFVLMSTAFHYLSRLKKDDIIYNPLPLYHTAGGMLGLGQMLIHGLTIAVRKKFSASNYWSDCKKYKCTVAQYVGEMCRYVLSAPRKYPLDHSVRAIFGNGLKAQIWNEFVKTFNIKEVYEFYGATEGISNMINIDNTPGSIGFIPRYVSIMYPMLLIKCDLTGEPIRNTKGYCMECGINQPGLVITKINPKNTYQSFKGYVDDEKSTNSKILQNVFVEGDRYFNSGDILEKDEFGYFYFKDRTGDTFRWKSENVSTSEVEAIISNVVQLNDAVVYGVEIPNTEGKAGMAAIVDEDDTLNLEILSKGLRQNLPFYAIPIFVRIMKSVPITGTYKFKKKELQEEGYDVQNISDKIYFYDNKSKTYVELTKQLHSEIISGKVNV